MKHFVSLLLVIFAATQLRAADNKIFYKQPATDWQNEALPIGNGYIGAMIFGGVFSDEIQLSEESIWSGGPNSQTDYRFGNRQGSWKYLNQIRELLKEGKQKEAAALASKYMTGQINKTSDGSEFGDYGSHQTFGSVIVTPLATDSTYNNYYRELDIAKSLASAKYKRGNVNYNQQYFASYPARLVVACYTNDCKTGMDYKIEFKTPHKNLTDKLQGNSIVIEGKHAFNNLEMESEIYIRTDGTLKEENGEYKVEKAKRVELYITIATDYKNSYPTYRGGDLKSKISSAIEKAKQTQYKDLLLEHQKDYRNLFNRVDLKLGRTSQASLPTNERIYLYSKGANDPDLEALYFQYGRYLLISSSRPGTLPANLQGKWNNKMNAPWAADYHMNINLQMIYWPAEPSNLSECHQPLLDYINSLREPGRVTAREYFNARGWQVHTMNNAYGFTAPGWDFYWGYAPNGSAWLCDHLYKHYVYTKDENFRKTAYQIMKEAVEFWLDYLTPDTDGTLVSSPSYSPEHGDITAGATIDQEVAYDLFTNIIEIGKDFPDERMFLDSITNARAKLSPIKIGRFGQLQEWKEDLDSPTNEHRHVSHLYALFPGKQIAPKVTPKLAEAAKRTLLYRGDGGTGWSLAWKINFWARLLDGDHAYRLFRNLLTPAEGKGKLPSGAGTYSNLLCAHPPYQLDGNMGAVSGIIEMLMQSHNGYIEILPALPTSWPTGSVKGLKAQGNFTVDIDWKDGLVKSVRINSPQKGECLVRYKGKDIKVTFNYQGTKSLTSADLID